MLLLAVMNGAARDLWYKKYVGDLTAHQISTVSLILIFGLYVWLVNKKFPFESGIQAIYTGICWLILTLTFEFGFGLMRGNSLPHLLEDYNIMKGRIWILIPLWITIAPYIFYKITRS